MDILIDFDGTCVYHEFPAVGQDIPNAVKTLKSLVENGHNLILFTMRSDRHKKSEIIEEAGIHNVTGNFLTDAIRWFKERDIPLYGIQTNPTQALWTTSPKAYGQLIIDDIALGCPTSQKNGRKYVNWEMVELQLKEEGLI